MQHIITLLGKIMEVSAQITFKGAYNVRCYWSGHVKELNIEVHDTQTHSIIHAAASVYAHDPAEGHWSGDPTETLERLLNRLTVINMKNRLPANLPGFTDHGGYSAGVVNLIAEREEVEA